MARGPHTAVLPDLARQELERCLQEGLTAEKTRIRLLRCGFPMKPRTVSRHLKNAREQQATERARVAKQEARWRELEHLGIGLGSVQIGAGPAVDLLNSCVPDWREKHSALLGEIFQGFLDRPTPEGFHRVVTGAFQFLISVSVTEL